MPSVGAQYIEPLLWESPSRILSIVWQKGSIVKHTIFIMSFAAVAIVLLVCIHPGGAVMAGEDTAPYSIVSMKAYLYYSSDGSLSENVIDNKNFSLFNVVIGEGSARGPSTSTMVVVELKGTPGAFAAKRTIEFVATCGGRTLLKKSAPIGLIGEKGRYFEAFWLYDTGISPVKLSAKIAGQLKSSSIEKTINFQGGE